MLLTNKTRPVIQAMGLPDTTFGNRKLCTAGPISEIKA